MSKSGSVLSIRATINGFLLPYIIQNLSIDGQTAAHLIYIKGARDGMGSPTPVGTLPIGILLFISRARSRGELHGRCFIL